MKKLLPLLFIPLVSFCQINEQSKLNLENKKEKIVKFSEVESAPFYIDWCTSNLAEDKIKECTDSGIKLFAKQNFNTRLANELKLTGYQRITSAFTINKNGDIKEGDEIISSGLGGRFPEGFLLGKVSNIKQNDQSNFLLVTVKNTFDFSFGSTILFTKP